jgi:hypothetical protein
LTEEENESGSKRRKSRPKAGDLVFVACLLIGLGVGIALNQVSVAVLIGLGFGFLGLAMISWRNKE